MCVADRATSQRRATRTTSTCATRWSWALAQCVALIPGVSRSGATIAAGLFRGLDRVTVTRMSFFLAIPALTAAGIFQAVTESDEICRRRRLGPDAGRGRGRFVVAYASIAWLLRYVARHNFGLFIVYRIASGSAVCC